MNIETDVSKNGLDTSQKNLKRLLLYMSLVTAWIIFNMVVAYLEFSNSSRLSLSPTLWMLGLSIFSGLSVFLLWKRNLWVVISFGIFTLLSFLTPLFFGPIGYQMIDIVRAIYSFAVYFAIYKFWKDGLFEAK